MRFARGSPWRPAASAASSQCRGVGAAADVGVADGRHLAVRAGERDLPGAERPIGVRDLRLGLLAGEPAELRAADADAGQDPALVLLTPRIQDAGADAGGEQEAQDQRDAEAEGERPSAPRRCRGLAVGHGGRERQDRHGIDAGLGGIRPGVGRGIRPGIGGVGIGRSGLLGRLRCLLGGQRWVGVVRWCVAPDERRELGVAGRRLEVGRGGVGSAVGCGVGLVGHQRLTRDRDDRRGRSRWGRARWSWDAGDPQSLGRSEREPVRDDPRGPCVTFPVSQVAQPPRSRTTIRRFGSSPIDCVATCG